jgi:hypothetical protein
MRLLCAFAIAAVLALVPFALDGRISLQAKIVCGNFGQGFTCKSEPGADAFGKNATPGAPPQAAEPSPQVVPPDGTWQGTTVPTESGQGAAGAPADANACQNGMIGTPPNCRCPKNSELLGGNCVHYTASACSAGLAADALPQACRGVEEKLSCTLRQDGLKDCCCVIYDKF